MTWAKESPKEVIMEKYFLLYAVLGITILLFRVFFQSKYWEEKRKETKEKAEKHKRLRFAARTIKSAVEDYASAMKPNYDNVCSKFGVISSGTVDRQIDLYNFINNVVFKKLGRYQDFFDQVLKMYADKLQKIYDEEGKRKKLIGPLPRDRYSSEEIGFTIEENEYEEREKKDTETKFWILHNTLRDLGLRTWGRSYKFYVALKPIPPSITLNF
jgi:hypothetical protein